MGTSTISMAIFHIYSGFSHSKWWIFPIIDGYYMICPINGKIHYFYGSIAFCMLYVYQRVYHAFDGI